MIRKKYIAILFVVLCLAFLFPAAGHANKVRAFTALTGGADGALDKITSGYLENGDISIVVTSVSFYMYSYDSTSSDAESSPDVIQPDDLPATGKFGAHP